MGFNDALERLLCLLSLFFDFFSFLLEADECYGVLWICMLFWGELCWYIAWFLSCVCVCVWKLFRDLRVVSNGGYNLYTVARGIALYGGFGEVPNVGSRKCKKPKKIIAFEGLRHHLNVLQAHMEAFSILFEALVCI
jgi:hypothetical protein